MTKGNEVKSEDWEVAIIVVVFAVTFALIAFLAMASETQQMKECVSAGNQWIESSCIVK